MTATRVDSLPTSIANLGGASLYWSQMRPREFLVSDKPLPRTNLEKISRQSLPALYEALTGKTVSAIKASVTD
jgi:hypothetical protein